MTIVAFAVCGGITGGSHRINGDYNHDVAVVYASNPYIISIMTKGESDEFIAQLSKMVYDELQ